MSHELIENFDDIERFQKSKYVQSDIREIYQQIKQALLAKRHVLFVGTPCQVAAVQKYADHEKLNRDLLLTVEIICWGVPSPGVFREHIDLIQRKYQADVMDYNFRDKREGWGHPYKRSVRLQNGTEIYNDDFLQACAQLYGKRLDMREACFSCPYAKSERVGDITIGDCWGIEKIYPDFANKNGVSQVWLNSEKGSAIWNAIQSEFDVQEVSVDQLLPYNNALKLPAVKPKEYASFWRDYKKHGYEFVLKKYTYYGFVYRNLAKAKRRIMKLIKRS